MRSLTCSPGWVQRAFNLLLLLVLTTTSAGLLGFVSLHSAAAAPATQDEQAVRTVNLELILDLSGSMARDIGGGETRMEAAKRVMNDVIDALPEREGVNVGFRIYGHLGNNTEAGRDVSCQSSDLVVPIQGVNKPALRDQVAAAEPIGWTPIALSLQRAGGDFQPGEGVANHILLVTDGEETCGGDPCAVAESLREGDARLTTHVVGFALTEEQAIGLYDVSWAYATGGEISIRVNIEAGRTTWIRGSLLKFPQGAGEIYVVKDLAGTVIWQAPFEEGDYVWVLPGIYTMDLVERVGDPVLIMAQVQTLPGSETELEVFTAP